MYSDHLQPFIDDFITFVHFSCTNVSTYPLRYELPQHFVYLSIELIAFSYPFNNCLIEFSNCYCHINYFFVTKMTFHFTLSNLLCSSLMILLLLLI